MNRKLSRFIFIILIFAFLIQLAFLVRNYAPIINRIRKDVGKSAIWREVSFSSHNNLADYIEWIIQNTPEDAKILVPPVGYLTNYPTPFFQFFLSPRNVENCTGDYFKCASGVLDSDYYILVINPGDFPGEHYDSVKDR